MLLALVSCLVFRQGPQPGPWDCQRLSGPMPTAIDGDIQGLVHTDDGAYLVYLARESAQEPYDLFSARADGAGLFGNTPHVVAEPRRLNDPALDGGHPTSFEVAGGSVVYRLLHEATNKVRFHGVPVDGSSAPVRLTPDFVAGGNVVDRPEAHALSPDGSRFVYIADARVDDRFELIGVSIHGGDSVVLNHTLTSNRSVHDFAVDPTSARVVYRVLGSGEFALYSAPLDRGGMSVPLSGPLPTERFIAQVFRISPGGSHVVYSAAQPTAMTNRLYSVAIDGSAPPVLLAPAFAEFVVAPDDRSVVFRTGGFANGRLHAVPMDGSAPPVLLSGTTPVYWLFSIDPASERVLFRGGVGGDHLHSVPVDGSSPPVQLDDGKLIGAWDVVATPEGRAVFPCSIYIDRSLASAPIDGTSGPVQLDTDVESFQLGAGGARVVYQKRASAPNLWSTPVDGSSPPIALDVGTESRAYSASPRKPRVAWIGPGLELFVRALDARAPAVQLTPRFPRNAIVGSVERFALGDQRIVYAADQELDGRWALHSVAPAGGLPLRITPTQSGSAFFSDLRVAARGTRAVYRSEAAPQLLYSAALDGSDPEPIALSESIVESYGISADGSRACFLHDDAYSPTNTGDVLFVVPVDGSAPAVPFSPTLPEAYIERDYQMSGDGQRVAYRGFRRTAPYVWDLYSSDGHVHRRIASMPDSRDLVAFTLDSAGANVYFVADALVEGRYDLFRVPTDGSSPPVALVETPVPSMDVASDFRLSPDESTVVFRAGFYERERLYSVAASGGKPVAIDTATLSDGTTQILAIDAAGVHVVYVSGTVEPFAPEVFVARIDGVGDPVRLSTDPGHLARVSAQISADGGRLVYVADQDSFGVRELYSSPLDGSQPPVKLNAELTANEDVQTFAISPDSAYVAYSVRESFPSGTRIHLVPIDRSHEPVQPSCEPLQAESDFTWTRDSTAVLYRAMVQHHGFELFAGRLERPGPPLRESRMPR